MNQRTARLLASVVEDEWPFPKLIKRRIASHPEVLPYLEKNTSLADRLRNESEGISKTHVTTISFDDPSFGSSVDQASQKTAARNQRLKHYGVAIAAMFLVCFAGRYWLGTSETEERINKPIPDQVDLRPVIASLSASQTIAKNVSSGFRDLGNQLAAVSGRLGNQLRIEVQSDDPPEPEDSQEG